MVICLLMAVPKRGGSEADRRRVCHRLQMSRNIEGGCLRFRDFPLFFLSMRQRNG